MGKKATDWELKTPLGDTGQAFMGVKNNERLFFKLNTSPFVATLSAEGIAPRLKWARRTIEGDILTAQEWHDGRLLTPDEMMNTSVIDLIHYIHHCDHLLNSLEKIHPQKTYPINFIDHYFKELPIALANHHFFNEVIDFLENDLDEAFYNVDYVVCHGDLHHLNFLESLNNHLYLVDWEEVKIADPLSDITFLLCQYFPPSQWSSWFREYQMPMEDNFYKRVQWYSLMNALRLIKHFYLIEDYEKANQMILLLRAIYKAATRPQLSSNLLQHK